MDRLRKDVILEFWKNQSKKTTNRWTGTALLDFESNYLKERRKQFSGVVNILDLGSGAGELSRTIQQNDDFLTAVDYEEGFRRFFLQRDLQTFVTSDVLKFESESEFDFILLYGLVTHLTANEELEVYRIIHRHLAPDGLAIIKNQVSRSDELVINSYSNELKSEYSARYPSVIEQELNLKSLFGNVEILEYPKEFNKFINTFNVAFFVRK
jgi:2-polyprenyl-3-methyl-5-hydroxy-6-metoxy-1,4-benzoquinol methylase